MSPVDIAKEATNFRYKLWENNDLTAQPVIMYIYLCEWWYASCLYYFSKRLPVMDQKLNWNARLALELIYLHFHIQTVGA